MQVLERCAPTAPGVFLYYPSGRQMTPKLRAFVDHVKSRSDAANKASTRSAAKRTRHRKRG